MMKNLRKNALISLLFVLTIVLFLTGTVYASGDFLQGSGEILLVNQTSENQTSENTTANTVQNTTTNILGVTNTVTPTNVQRVNNINDASKDIPQTGENDIYMITTIGIVAIAIGGIAYAKSKKYDIK